jgi:amino acid adenylation domain-containing protein
MYKGGAMNLPPEQEAIRATCFHPLGHFVEFPKDDVETSIPERFEKIVRMYPERIAISTEDEQITYDELNAAANRIANSLVAQYGSNQEPVVLFYERSISLVVAYLAVLKAGKIAIHLAPSVDRGRITHVLEDSQALIVLTDRKSSSLAAEVENRHRRVINVDGLNPELNDSNLRLAIGSDAFAYIRYTSGSTKNAKGAVRTHSHILQAAMDLTNSLHISADDRVAVFGRDYGGKNLFITLLSGAAQFPISLADDGIYSLADWLTKNQITILISLPTVFRSLLTETSGKTICPSLRLICLGSEPLYKSDVASYQKHLPADCLLLYTYGSSETGIICEHFIDKNTEIHGNRVPVGYPRGAVEVSVIDDLGKNAPANQTGEIVVKSRHLSSGYWQKGEVKKERFHSRPDEGQETSYYTGDLGRVLPNGILEHLGRKDSMIKIRGLKADVAEIEAVLANHPGLREVAVVAKDAASNESKIVAYYVQRAGSAPTITEFRTFLAEKLPNHMIPAAFIRLDVFPLTATGKVNRRKLPNPETSRPELDTKYVKPGTPVEQDLSRIWSDVLALEQVGIHDNFFDLGGHSLAAARVVSRIVQHFQLKIPLQLIFQSPTVAEMAAVINEHKGKTLSEKELVQILTELESLSEDDAEKRLSEISSPEVKNK